MENNRKHRYEISKVTKDGVPYILVVDNYLAPLIKNEYLFKYENIAIKEDDIRQLNEYGSSMIDVILSWFSDTQESKNLIVVTDPMLMLKHPLQELENAMEWYDDRTGSKSSLNFETIDKNGEGFSIKTFNNGK